MNFNILSTLQPIDQSLFIEASAGTGKTFSIENLYVRLLLEENEKPFSIHNILVVTFTRKAAKDLQLRIVENIFRALSFFSDLLEEKEPSLPLIYEYLWSFKNTEKEHLLFLKRKLEEAYFESAHCHIFTIHGFAAKALQNHPFEELSFLFHEENSLRQEEWYGIIEDFFQIHFNPMLFGLPFIEKLLAENQFSLNQLKKSIREEVLKGEIKNPHFNFSTHIANFEQKIESLRLSFSFSYELLLEDLFAWCSLYKKLTLRNGSLKKEVQLYLEKLARLFTTSSLSETDLNFFISSGWLPGQWFAKENLKVSQKKISFHYPLDLFFNTLNKEIPFFLNIHKPFQQLVFLCQQMGQTYIEKKGKSTFDLLIKKLHAASKKNSFVKKIQGAYEAIVIDEFQDTDPLQWDIFKTLFLEEAIEKKKRLFLVGDPKQSIYAFRQADIYTFLEAKYALNEKNAVSLNSNFRSTPELIQAINLLCGEETTDNFLFLPKKEMSLPYFPITAGKPLSLEPNKKEKGAIHFLFSENTLEPTSKPLSLNTFESTLFFPFLEKTLKKYHAEGIPFSEMVLLVSDRFQAARASSYLKTKEIPVDTQRNESLKESVALSSFQLLIEALSDYYNPSTLKKLLLTPLFGATFEEALSLNNQETLSLFSISLKNLRDLLNSKGFVIFFNKVLETIFPFPFLKNHSLEELLVLRPLKENMYADILSIGSFFSETIPYGNLEETLFLLEQIHIDPLYEDSLQKESLKEQDAVPIMTIHTSKGLEFEVVFALAVLSAFKENTSFFVPTPSKKGTYLEAFHKESPEKILYEKELLAEKMRQFYVAITRAKSQVFIPCEKIIRKKNKGISLLDQYLHLFKHKTTENAFLSFFNWFQEIADSSIFSYSFLSPLSEEPSSFISKEKEPLLLTLSETVIQSTLQPILSFTQLHRLENSSFPRGTPSFTKESLLQEPSSHFRFLPKGAETGTLIHSILEELFSYFPLEKDPSLLVKKIIKKHTSSYLDSKWDKSLYNLIEKLLNTKLKTHFDSFYLSSIVTFITETEFLYPTSSQKITDKIVPSSIYLTGFVDLIFEKNNKFYILDWKTNYLGDSPEDYHLLALQKAMDENDYFLQAKIYQDALEKWLKIFKKTPFKEYFGGIFYVFLRGLDNEETQGIYWKEIL